MEKQKNANTVSMDVKMKILYVDPVEACKLMDSDMRGLSSQEALKRLKEYGKNEIIQGNLK